MRRLDGYVLRQLLVAFAFFALILTGVIWLGQAVPLIDTVVASGNSLLLFLLFSLYVLPVVLMIVLPLAAFAGALYGLNKLYSDSELVVMMAAGQSPFALARPLLLYSLIAAVLTGAVTVYMLPWGERRLSEGRAEIQSELAGALIREGQFVHPAPGITLFIHEASTAGRMEGLFLHDERDPGNPVTYSAAEAVFLRDGPVARLVMSDGIALSFTRAQRMLSRVRFDEFTYDLSDLIAEMPAIRVRPESYGLRALLAPTPEMLANERYGLGDFLAVGHEKIVLALNALLMPMLALAVMITGNYQRRGFARRMTVAIGLGVALAAASVVAKSATQGTAALWPAFYAGPAVSLALVLLLLRRAARGPARTRAEAA